MNLYEQKIIGAIVAGTLKPSGVTLEQPDFTDAELGAALVEARRIESEGKNVDAELLHSRLHDKDLGFYSARDFEIMARAAQSASVVYEAIEKVRSVSLKAFLTAETASLALKDNLSAAEIVGELKRILAKADQTATSADSNFVFLSELAPRMRAFYDDLYNGVSYAVPTFFPMLDAELLDGFSKGDLHVIAGFTGAGKSAFALNCARNQALNGIPVGIVSREMSDIENVVRLQSADAEIPRWQIKKQMFDLQFQKLNAHLQKFSDLPIAIDTRTTDVETLRQQTRQMVEQYNFGVVYIDYLQLMKSSARDTRAQEVAAVSRGLKEIAMENNIPVVALCQFNRGAANASAFDLLNHLKESSGIEQDASTILYVQVEKTEERKQVKEAKLTLLKNRNGSSFTPIDMKFRGECFQFYEL